MGFARGIPDGPGIPEATIKRVECPIHGDTWAFGYGNDPGGCLITIDDEDLNPRLIDIHGCCAADPVCVTYVLKSEYDRES